MTAIVWLCGLFLAVLLPVLIVLAILRIFAVHTELVAIRKLIERLSGD